MRKWFRSSLEWWKRVMQDTTKMVRVECSNMTQVPMLPPGMIQESAKLVKGCPCWLHARHNSGPPASSRNYSGPQSASHSEAWPTCSDGEHNRQIPLEWPENKDSLDMMQERCRPLKDAPGKEKAHPSRMHDDEDPLLDGTRKLQIPLGWHEEDDDPSGMVCWLCRLLQYGTWKMHIPPGWQRMIKTPPGWYQMQIPLGWCKGAGDPPRQCKGCADSSGIADDSDPSTTAQGKTDPFKMAGTQIPPGLHKDS